MAAALTRTQSLENTAVSPSTTTLSDAPLYFKCCRIAYHSLDDIDDRRISKWLLKYRLRFLHSFADPQREVQYCVLERLHADRDQPIEYIFAFRGLIESFDFGDILPFQTPSPITLNRYSMLRNTALVSPPVSVCDGCYTNLGRCHEGIRAYYQRCEADIDKCLHNSALEQWLQCPNGVKIVFAGFSMGCGLAALSALRVRHEAERCGTNPTIKVVNFGSPKLGDAAFASLLMRRITLYDNYYIRDDPVASYPDTQGYVVTGNLFVLSPSGGANNAKAVLWKARHYPSSSLKSAPLTQAIVTTQQMTLGMFSAVSETYSIPCLGVLQNCRRCHCMNAIKSALATQPILATDDQLTTFSDALVEVEHERKACGWFTCFGRSCGGRNATAGGNAPPTLRTAPRGGATGVGAFPRAASVPLALNSSTHGEVRMALRTNDNDWQLQRVPQHPTRTDKQ